MTALGTPQHAPHGADRERRAAAERWLYEAAASPALTAGEWAMQGVALLTAGITWDAVRAPYTVLDPGFDRDTTPELLRHRLAELQLSAAAFSAYYRPHFYILVPPGTDRRWPHRDSPAGVECLGSARTYINHIGVPRLDRTTPPGPFWLIPPDHGRRLADPERLRAVLHACAEQLDQAPSTP
ncbi:hypothetical protein [Streptomyces misionensis]|nr:hypothetical protein [Streptomyces misionensis]